MTTLEAIGFNVAAGASLGTVALLSFGVAVLRRHEFIAPRCTARPKNVIFNPHAHRYNNSLSRNPASAAAVQDRGSALLGWIPFTLNLTYDNILRGVEGTGTRKGGLEGVLLRGNLDAIVLLRFHALGAKISALATFLAIVVLLPMYWTGQCHEKAQEEDVARGADDDASEPDWATACATGTYNLTNYERTTIANVPSALDDDVSSAADAASQANQEANVRLYFCVLCFWLIQGYLLHLLKREWIEILAMRRVYYLEANVWGDRKEELTHTPDLYSGSSRHQQSLSRRRVGQTSPTTQQQADNKGVDVESGGEAVDDKKQILSDSGNSQTNTAANNNMRIIDEEAEEDEFRLTVRDPWIPHPEHRDTVPNVQLYSVLVGGLPSLPQLEEVEEDENDGGLGGNERSGVSTVTTQQRQSMDWQLALTAAFFDHCVPNQPGYSSSVAAVTILPSSKAVASAWRKWYKAAKKLRRLRFIRAQMAQRYHDELMLMEEQRQQQQQEVPSALLSSQQGLQPLDQTNSESKPPDTNEEGNAVPTQAASAESSDVESSSNANNNDIVISKSSSSRRRVAFGDEEDEESTASKDDNPSPVLPAPSSMSTVQPQPSGASSSVGTTLHNSDNTNASTAQQQYREYYEQIFRGQEHNMVVPVAAPDSEDKSRELRLQEADHDDEPEEAGEAEESFLINQFGPEQTAIYSREFAQSAAPCCPNGCCEGAVTTATMEELQDMEQLAVVEVVRANQELWKEQQLAKELRVLSHDDHAGGDGPANGDTDGDAGGNEEEEENESEENVDGSSDPISAGEMSGSNELRKRRRRRKKRLPDGLAVEEHIYDRKAPAARSMDSDESGLVLHPLADATPASSSYRKRLSKWDKVRSIVSLTTQDVDGRDPSSRRRYRRPRDAITGQWKWPTWQDFMGITRSTARNTTRYIKAESRGVVDVLTQETTYAVVTFTSRQAAVAARQCLADSRSPFSDRWIMAQELPVPPLSDAAAWDLLVFRNCCRPVTVSIDEKQKLQRHYGALLFLGGFYVFAPFVLALFSSLLVPEALEEALPKLFRWLEDAFGGGISETVAGFLQSTLYTTFFALCPVFFKSLSNFGSNANSFMNAELNAMQYFWWFMVMSAFSGTLIANMFLFGLNDGVDGDLRSVLLSIARAIPSTTAASWLNWIVLRTTFVMTAQYLLQMPAFLFGFLGLKCFSRVVRGGGPGPPTPYRLYVDSGMVLLSLLALAPASPLVAPAAFFYFLWSQPILRRCVIFVYRPKFDAGGQRWPFIFAMCISALLIGHTLLTLQMVLKQAPGPAVMAAVPSLVTLYYYYNLRKKFLAAFYDAALLQTSLLDGWGDASRETTTMKRREDFREFLVDAHKAAYVPVCLAGTDSSEASFTAEPAVVVPLEYDLVRDHDGHDMDIDVVPDSPDKNMQSKVSSQRRMQFGAILRRAVQTLQAMNSNKNVGATSSPNEATKGPMAVLKEGDEGESESIALTQKSDDEEDVYHAD